MSYLIERDLQKDLADIDPTFLGHYNSYYSKREVPIGGCIPDLIIIGIDQNPTNQLLPNDWNAKHIYILWLLKKYQELTLNQIADLCFQPIEKSIKTLNPLLKSGAIISKDPYVFSLSYEFGLIDAKVCAIEAKLKRWQEAIKQAENYQRFADVVVVAMDHDWIPREEQVINVFKSKRIGLCSVSSSHVGWVIKPQEIYAHGFEKEYLISSVISPERQRFWSRRNL